MRRAYLLAVLALLLCTVPGLVVADVIGSPVLGVTAEDDAFVPGEETDLEVTVTNSGRVREGSNENQQLNDRVTTARGLTVTADDSDAPVTLRTDTRSVGTLAEGQTTVRYSMSVAEDAEPGTYEIPVEAQYRFTHIIEEGTDGGDEVTLQRTETFDVEITIEDDARLEIVDVSSQARVGSTGTVAVTVENAGTETASDAALTLESRNAELSFGDTSSATRQLGEWKPGERRTVEYRLAAARSAGPQPYTFAATAEYEDTDGRSHTSETQTLAIPPQQEQTFAVESVESAVAVGETGTVTVRVRNEGPVAVTDASVALASAGPALTFAGSDSATRFAGAWAPGETRTLEYDITATDEADTRSYALEATVTYQDPEGDTETAPARTLGVEPAPEQSFAIETVASTLRVGHEGRLEGQVRNTGDATVSNAVVVFGTDKPNVTPIETEAPVGDLAPGEAASFSLPVEISDAGEPGAQQYSLHVRYRTQDGDQRTSDTIDVRQDVGPDARLFALETSGTTVEPGSGTVLEITVTNTGEKRFTDISANMFADSPMSVTDDEAFIASLEPGESETVTFSVGASGGALEKAYPVSLDFQYDEPDGDTKLSQTYKIPVSVEASGDRGGPSLLLVGAVLLVLVLGGGYLYRRYG
jgi:hypothetical protein